LLGSPDSFLLAAGCWRFRLGVRGLGAVRGDGEEAVREQPRAAADVRQQVAADVLQRVQMRRLRGPGGGGFEAGGVDHAERAGGVS
jgi:hypothetical protein